MLAGIGFTVSLLIGELAFERRPGTAHRSKTGVLLASVIAAVLASVLLLAQEGLRRAGGDRGTRRGR